MEYSIDLSHHASQFLNKLDASSLQRITTKLDWYSEHFEKSVINTRQLSLDIK